MIVILRNLQLINLQFLNTINVSILTVFLSKTISQPYKRGCIVVVFEPNIIAP